MSAIYPERYFIGKENQFDHGEKSPSNRSSLSSRTNRTAGKSTITPSPSSSTLNRTLRLQAGPSLLDIPTNLSDDESEFDDRLSSRENLRFAPRMIRRQHQRKNSTTSIASRRSSFQPSRPITTPRKTEFVIIQAPRTDAMPQTSRRVSFPKEVVGRYSSAVDQRLNIKNKSNALDEMYGETLIHLSARLGHDEITRLLINETSQASTLLNRKGQTPLLIAIGHGSTSTAMLLMESNPRSIILSDSNQSSVFHYACEYSNDLVLHRAIVLSKRLHSTTDRLIVSGLPLSPSLSLSNIISGLLEGTPSHH